VLIIAIAILIFPVIMPVAIAVSYEDSAVPLTKGGTTRILSDGYDDFTQGDFSDVDFSNITLYLTLDEDDAIVNGTMLIDFYNDAPISIDRIPFHLYTSGMQSELEIAGIYPETVTSIGDSPEVLSIDFFSDPQILWVYFVSDIQPSEYVSLNITFSTIIPEGQDRCGVYGSNLDETRIITFTGSYPIPCVYDEFDGWNTDPYVSFGDPFYFDMAFYDLYLEVPDDMVIAANFHKDIKKKSYIPCVRPTSD